MLNAIPKFYAHIMTLESIAASRYTTKSQRSTSYLLAVYRVRVPDRNPTIPLGEYYALRSARRSATASCKQLYDSVYEHNNNIESHLHHSLYQTRRY